MPVLGCSWCPAGDPAPTQPPKDHSYLSHKKSLLKNKVLPSFVYNSGKQSSALCRYSTLGRVDSDTSLAEPCTKPQSEPGAV